MADISVLARLLNGALRNVDLASNTPVVFSIKVGGASSNTELTKSILDNLISNSHAPGSDNQNIIAGSGLTGGGSTASVNIAVDNTVIRTSGVNAFTADQSMGSNKITNLTAGTANTDAVNKGQMDTAIASATPTGVLKADGTIPMTGNLNANSNKIVSLANGTASGDAVNKGQLDGAISGLSSVYIPASEKGANNGVATLDGGGKIPASQLPNTVMELQGFWNASTNTPALADGSGNPGDVYEVDTAGSVNFGSGSITFAVGDWAVYAADGKWHKSVNSNEVTSVNGQTGTVSLNTDNVSEGSTNKYYTSARFDADLATKTTDDLTEGSTNLYFTAARAKSAAVADAINNGTTDVAPSQNAVFDALALKADSTHTHSISDVTGLQTALDSKADVTHQHDTIGAVTVTGESLAANTIFAMRYGKSGDSAPFAGKMFKADYDASSVDNFYVDGVLCTAGSLINAGSSWLLVKAGLLYAPAHGLTIGLPIYLAANGAITQTAPSTANQAVVYLGKVQDADNLQIRIQVMGIN